jgi:hypothetical protein
MRKFFIGLFSLILFAVVAVGVPMTSASLVLTNRDNPKLWLSKPEVYQALSLALLSGDSASADVPQEFSESLNDANQPAANDPNRATMEALLKKYFTLDAYTRSVNQTIDSLYDWLEGKTAQPHVSFALTQDREELRNFITSVYSEEFNNLPACPGPVDRASFNPLESSCKPADYTNAELQAFIATQTSGPEFESLFGNVSQNQEQAIDTKNAQGLQSNYKLLKNAPLLSLLLGVLSVAGIAVLMHRRRAIKVVTLTSLLAALLALVAALLARGVGSLILNAVQDSSGAGGEIAKVLATAVVKPAYLQINSWTIITSCLIFGLSGAGLIIYRIIRPKPIAPATPVPKA